MLHTGWDCDLSKIPDVSDIASRANSDSGELNSLPFLFKVAIVASAIMSGKTQAEARTAVRQAFNILRP